MRKALTVLVALTAAVAYAGQPPTPLARALAGPVKAFEGRQRVIVAVNGSKISSEVTVRGNGAGAVRRTYASGISTLQRRQTVWQKKPGEGWTRLPASVTLNPAALAGRIAANYRVTLLPKGSILGRACIPIRVEAKHACNPSRRIWLDEQTGVILKDELLAPGGRLRSSSTFVSFAARPQPASVFSTPAAVSAPTGFGPSSFRPCATAAAVERMCGRPILLPRYVPAGYRLETYGAMTTRMGRFMPAIRYSDGLASFTIFQRGYGAGTKGPASDIQRSVVAVRRPRSNYLLVGDLSESELRRIAESLP